MNEHLENVALVSRRNGRPDDIADVEMDLENGYTYRLLEKWGVRRELDFSEDCPGRRMLEQFGVPDPHIANIAANFRVEQKGCRTRGFENIIRRTMKEFEIPDTVPNRERAMMAFFGGRADALLDVEERYPLADRSKSALTGGTPPVPTTATLVAAPSPLADIDGDETACWKAETGSTDIPCSLPSPAAEPPAPAQESASVGKNVPSEAEPDGNLEIPAEPDVVDDGDKLLPLSAFAGTCDEMVKSKGDEWTKATANDARALVRIFIGILGEHGIEHSGQITQWHIGRLRQHFNDIPTRYGQSARMRAMSTAELRQEALRMAEEAKASGQEPPKIGLGAATVRKHLGNLEHFLKHLRGNGYKVPSWTFEGLRPKKPKLGTVRHQQYKPKPQDIRPIFTTPVFTGCANEHKPELPGDDVYHNSNYFLPLLITYLGARRNELAGLAPEDVLKHPEFGWIIHIRPNDIRRIKNVQSDRLLPLPEELVRLNFLEYRKAIRQLGHRALFPELFSHLTVNDPGDRFYKEFTPIMKKSLGEAMWERSYHALRHGLANTLKQSGVPDGVIDDISGRLSDGETNTRYTAAAEPPLMRDALAKFPVITDHLVPHPIRLLPWVEKKLPPPWARESRSGSNAVKT